MVEKMKKTQILVKIGAEADILVGGVDDEIKDKSVSVPVQVVNPDTPLHTYIYLMLLNFGKSVVCTTDNEPRNITEKLLCYVGETPTLREKGAKDY